MSDYAVNLRYPTDQAQPSRQEAQDALALAEKVVHLIGQTITAPEGTKPSNSSSP